MRKTVLRSLPLLALALVLVLAALPAAARGHSTYYVTVTNVTPGQVLSPPIAVSHSNDVVLWRTGSPAIPELAAVAEDADASGLMDLLDASPEVNDYAIADGPLMPGHSVVLEVDAPFPFALISVVGMLVTTNDAFYGVNSAPLPFRRMRDVHRAPAYDAGTEENNELCEFIPGPPCGNAHVRATDGAEGFVHIHNGIHGVGDLEPSTWDWRNPVADVAIQVKR